MRAPSAELTVEDWSVLNAHLEWCYEGGVNPELLNLFTRRPNLFAWLVEAGSASIVAGERTWTAGPGEWLCGGPVPRRQIISRDARILSVSFTLRWPSGDSLIPQPFVVEARKEPGLARAARALRKFVGGKFPEVRTDLDQHACEMRVYFQLQKHFSTWIAAYIDATIQAGILPARMQGLDSRVLAVLRILDRHPWQHPYRNENTAQKVGLSAGHLDRLFVQSLGVTPRHYLQRRRLESARARLSESGVPVKTIAYDLGFSSSAHFCHWFQKATSFSPQQFRTRHEPSRP